MPQTSPDRLVSAVIQTWQSSGSAGISARQISRLTDTPTSSIYHHFGSLEGLMLAAQDAALRDAAAWCQSYLDSLNGHRPSADAFPALFTSLVDDWVHDHGDLAFAWREGQLQAVRDEAFRPVAARWRDLWSGFWLELCGHFAIPHLAAVTDRLFESESFLHMFRWRRPVDRAALDEMARGWGAWLTGAPAPPSPWRDFARAEVMRELPQIESRDETTMRILRAAATMIDRAGVSGVTHRAVAGEAGLTLGVVSHKFRTSAELLRAAFETIYTQFVTPRGDGRGSIPTDREGAIDALVMLIDKSAHKMGSEEFFLAVARDPSLGRFAGYLRFLRGQTTGLFLEAIMGPQWVVSSLDRALFSNIVSGQIRAHAHVAEEERGEQVRRELADVIGLLDRR